MLLQRKTDYYFESYNVSNIASPVTNNVRNLNGPRYKKTVTAWLLHAATVKVFKLVYHNCIKYNTDTLDKAHRVKYTLHPNVGLP